MANRQWNDQKYSQEVQNLAQDDLMMVFVAATNTYHVIKKQGLYFSILGGATIGGSNTGDIVTNSTFDSRDKDSSSVTDSNFANITGISYLSDLITKIVGNVTNITDLASLQELNTHLVDTSNLKHKASDIVLDNSLLNKDNVYDALIELSTGRNLKYRGIIEFTAAATPANESFSSDRIALAMGLIDENATNLEKEQNKLSSLPSIFLYDVTDKTTSGNTLNRVDGVKIEVRQVNNSIVLDNVVIPSSLQLGSNDYILVVEAGRIDASNDDVLIQSL